MGGFFLFEPLLRRLRESRLRKRIATARAWPAAEASITQWHVVAADPAVATSALPYQIEATFSFVLKGEYFGGYLRSVPMTHHQAEVLGSGEPAVTVRYNPANPDETAVLAEDNPGRLPFDLISG